MKLLIKVILFLFCLGPLSGCSPTTKGPVTEGICPPEVLEAPLFVAPSNNGYVTGPTANLQWSYPQVEYPTNSGSYCHPEKFRLTMKKGPLFTDAVGEMVDGTLTSWETPALEAGAEYMWSVSAMTDNTSGPFSGLWKFYVGETCSTETLLPPTPLQPFNGATLNHLVPTLMWENNDTCIPTEYHIDIATDPGFADILTGINTGNSNLSYTVSNWVSNCTRYYWRVAAVRNNEIQAFSETFSFRLSTEGCEAEPGAGSITGKLWMDMCPLAPSDNPPDPLPYGCVVTSSGVIANGVPDPGERGISDVVVRVAAGTCAANTPLGLTFTNIDGNYFLWGLQAGTYCIQIDPAENPIWMGTGWWTHPPAAIGNSVASYEINLAMDEDLPGRNFGWQFEGGGANSYNSLGGVVYHDLCAIPHGVGYSGPLPTGCVQHDGWVTGNWQREEGEPGIPGVEVELHKLMCSDPVFETTLTDENGFFHFMLEPGIAHCVVVNAMSTPNFDVLQPGVWSINPNNQVYEYSFNSPGEAIDNNEFFSFAWDYSNLPEDITDVTIPEMYPIFKPDFDINCRRGPDTIWQVLAKLKAGMELPIMAINPNRDWVQVQPALTLNLSVFPEFSFLAPDLRCWVLLETGSTDGDLGKVKVEFVLPPTSLPPTATSESNSCSGLSQKVCLATAGCKWVNPQVIPGYCTTK